MTLLTKLSFLLLCLSHAPQLSLCHPLGGLPSQQDEIVLVEEAVRYTDFGTNATATLITLNDPLFSEHAAGSRHALDALEKVEQLVHHQDNVDNESMMDTSAGAADDLIFLTVKKPTSNSQQQQTGNPQQQHTISQSQSHQHLTHHHRRTHEIDLLNLDDLSASTSSCLTASCETPDQPTDDAVDDAGVPREIELQTDDLLSSSAAHRNIDMRDFVSLIPAAEVKSIVANYYRNDPEVQRAYAYLSGRDFSVLKQRIIAIPEMSAFLRYLNASGLDVVGFFYTLTNLTSKPSESAVTKSSGILEETLVLNGTDTSGGNENAFPITTTPTPTHGMAEPALSTAPTTTTTTTTTTAETITTTTAGAAESLNGLHGLVDSILDILPQDQIMSTFFDKLEANEQFSKLVDNVGSPEFAKILHNMESSVPLRNLIFTLHNNGIYITRIVDSLKAYFFLGTF